MKCSMSQVYNNFSDTFSASRDGMAWPEVEYFLTQIDCCESILDVGCWNGRLLEQYQKQFWKIPDKYLWVDSSEGMIVEAQKRYPDMQFVVADMQSLSPPISESYENIIAIASFHHLSSLDARIQTAKGFYKLLPKGWKVYMTHWNLQSPLNAKKYQDSMIEGSENEFWSRDYSIKIGEHQRFYHSFSLEELKFLANESWFDIIEGIAFSGDRNLTTIWQKLA